MKEAVFQYKCRLCGEIFDTAHTSPTNAQMYLLNAVYGFKSPPNLIGVPPSIIETHPSCKRGYGIADLLGYEERGTDE